jgi:hypothetical protein
MRVWIATLALPPFVLAGCVIVPPDPTYQAVSLVSSALVSASSVVPGSANDAVVHEHGRIDNVCIQFNPAVGLDDFVSAVQRELRDNSVDSRIYEPGMQPADCKALLHYSAFLDWGQRAMDDRYAAYLTFASMTLSTSDGRVLASANYESGRMGLDKWSSTQSKISGVVKALLADRSAVD